MMAAPVFAAAAPPACREVLTPRRREGPGPTGLGVGDAGTGKNRVTEARSGGF